MEILFRAKSIKSRKWVTGFYFEEHDIPITKEDSHGDNIESETYSSYSIFNKENEQIWTEIEKKTVGQLVCHDKNENEVWSNSKVKYGSGVYGLKYSVNGWYIDDVSYPNFEEKDIEVVAD